MITPQSYARRLERQARRGETLPEDAWGECSCCTWWHLYPQERRVCPVCGRETCLGLGWVCECGEVVSEASGKLRDATERPATPGQVSRPVATYSLRLPGGHDAA